MRDRPKHDAAGDGPTQGRHPDDPFYAKGDKSKANDGVDLINAADIEPEHGQLAVAELAAMRRLQPARRSIDRWQIDHRAVVRRNHHQRRPVA